MADHIGKQLGNYRLIRLVGHGGFGDVYLGQHVHLERHAAIKVLHAHLAGWGEEAFRAEAQRLVDLEHPYIVRVLDFGIEAGISYLVMEYAPNGSLRERHPLGSRLPLDTIVLYVKHLADALQYVHERKLIHRDIKPANILLGSKNNLLLSDVGLAIVAHSTDSFSLQQMAGTPAYMAPEQAKGMAIPASDQYSLGVMVYEWLCGELPFTSSNRDGQGIQKELEEQHRSVPPPPLRGKIPTIPPSLETVVLTALAKEPQGRFVNVQAFANALEQASPGQPSLSKTVAPASGRTSAPTEPVAVTSPFQAPQSEDVITPPNQPSRTKELVERQAAPFANSNPPSARRTEERVTPIFTRDTPRRKTGHRRGVSIALLLFALLLIFASIGYAVLGSNLLPTRPVVTSPATTTASGTVTITPKSTDLQKSYTVSAVTGTPDPSKHQVAARSLSSTTPSYTKTANATGQGTTPSTQAAGTVSFENFGTSQVMFSSGTIFTANTGPHNGVEVMIDGAAVVPPSPDGGVHPGTTTVSAHVIKPGASGNFSSDTWIYSCNSGCSINTISGWDVYSNVSFTGGQDPQTYTVVSQNDINGAANALETTNAPNAQQALQPQIHANEQLIGSPQCNPKETSNHVVGDKATSVTVSVVFTCTGEVYDQQGALVAAEQWLKQDAVQNTGAGYGLVGNVVTKQTDAQLSDTNQGAIAVSIAAEGVWAYQFNDMQKHALANLIAGKKKGIAQSLLLQQQGIARIDIQVSGGDKDTLPTDLSRIKFVVLSVQGKST